MKILITILLSLVIASGIVTRLMEWGGAPTIWKFAQDMFLSVAWASSLYVAIVFGYALGCLIKHFNP